MTFCEIILVGNLGRDPEMRFMEDGKAICDLNLAVNRNRRVNNETVTETTWFRVTLWGKDADNAGKYLKKGKQVLIVGDRIEATAYVGNDGAPRASLQVNGRSFKMLGGRADGTDEGGGTPQRSSGGGQSSGYNDDYYGGPPESVDDIPF